MLQHFNTQGNLASVSLVDMAKIYEVPLSQMTQLSLYSNVGYLAGTLCGWLYSVGLPRQLLMGLFTLSTALLNTFTPYYRPFWVAIAANLGVGLGLGVYMSGYQAWLIEMTTDGMVEGADGTVMMASQAFYGIGLAFSPLLAAPFMYGERNVTDDGRPLTPEARQSSVAIPFLYTGVAQAIVPVVTIVLFFSRHRYQPPVAVLKKKKNESSKGDELSKKKKSLDLENPISGFESVVTTTKQAVPHRIAKLILCALMLALYSATELGYIPFAATLWQEMEIRMTVGEASRVVSVHSAAYTLGPLVTTFLSLRLHPDTVIWGHFGLLFLAASVLYFGRLSAALVYVGNGFLGYGMSAMSPSIYAFANRHLGVSSRVASSFSFTTALFSLVLPMVLTQYIDTQPLILIYLLIIFTLFSFALFVLLKLWIFISGQQQQQQQLTSDK